MRPVEPERRRIEQAEWIAARNRGAAPGPPARTVRLTFDGLSGVRCFEVEVVEADVTRRPGPPAERDLGAICEPLS